MRRIIVLAAAGLLAAACSSSGGGSASPGASASSAPVASTSPSASTAAATTKPSPTAIPACLPACGIPNLTRPGNLPAGDYTTKYFFGGQLTVTAPADWTSFEDSTGEFGLQPVGPNDGRVLFWIDVYPIVDGTFEHAKGWDGTAKWMIDWIEANPNITVIDKGAAKIGDLEATALEFGRSPKAVNVDKGCPAEIRPCVNLLSFPQWDGQYGVAGPFHVRIIAADASWGGKTHGVYAVIDTDNDDVFARIAPAAIEMIEGARLPVGVGQEG
jgi:hypothetical protein